jgi:hypothetical protein
MQDVSEMTSHPPKALLLAALSRSRARATVSGGRAGRRPDCEKILLTE